MQKIDCDRALVGRRRRVSTWYVCDRVPVFGTRSHQFLLRDRATGVLRDHVPPLLKCRSWYAMSLVRDRAADWRETSFRCLQPATGRNAAAGCGSGRRPSGPAIAWAARGDLGRYGPLGGRRWFGGSAVKSRRRACAAGGHDGEELQSFWLVDGRRPLEK